MIKENKGNKPKKRKSVSLRTKVQRTIKSIKGRKFRDITFNIFSIFVVVFFSLMLVLLGVLIMSISRVSLEKPGPQSYKLYSNEELSGCNFTVVITFETENPEFFATELVQARAIVGTEHLSRSLGDGNHTIEIEFTGSAILKGDSFTYPPVSRIKLLSNPDSESFWMTDDVTIRYDAVGVYPIRVELRNASETVDFFVKENAFPVQSASLRYQIEAISMQYNISMTMLLISFAIFAIAFLNLGIYLKKH